MWIALLLVACGPTTTGPFEAVGVVTGPDGAPRVGHEVQTIEGRAWTDAEGRFEVPWKAPSQHADLTWEGARYVRTFRPLDEGAVMGIRLPETRALTLRCERTAPCDLRLRWDLGEGLSAMATPECPDGATVEVPGVPVGAPRARCAPLPGVPPEEVPLATDGDVFVVQDAPALVSVEVRTEEGAAPEDCAVWIGGATAGEPTEGVWSREASGWVQVHAVCGGRATTPRRVRVAGPTTVAVDWSPLGADLDLAPWLPGRLSMAGRERLVVTRTDGDEGSWALPTTPDARGIYRLPPLPAGSYRLEVGEPTGEPPAGDDLAPDVVHLVEVDRVGDEVRGVRAVLRLDEDVTDGILPVRRH